ncbi:glyoxalase [Longispora fulva]|uniref:Putative lactoylglutathione lyase n=1 Tax=Longispora fulva TaxID=619741 RepID=A0A8J7G8H9_9ACTN|nr:VOC family protein [Longispora fulva]MBG6134905.1 putative lactoylglutathione lyase [Longispora fulva]GIG56863.1 glyoxalase [Longispora fulva]
MRQRLNLILLGVADVARSVAFYQELGWKRATAGSDEFALFDLGGVAIAFQSREAFAADARLVDHGAGGFAGFALAYVARSADEVYRVMARTEELGATVTRPAGANAWGHSGYFTDLDGHLFEVLYEDGWIFDSDDNLVL